MSKPIIITFDRNKLLAGEPCVRIDGKKYWSGFETTRGVIFLKAGDGKAWIEFHGEPEWIKEGGVVLEKQEGPDVTFGFNLWSAGALERLRDNPELVYGAVNRPRILAGKSSAVTVYRSSPPWGLSAMLLPEVRFEFEVRSVLAWYGDPHPLTIWIETTRPDMVVST